MGSATAPPDSNGESEEEEQQQSLTTGGRPYAKQLIGVSKDTTFLTYRDNGVQPGCRTIRAPPIYSNSRKILQCLRGLWLILLFIGWFGKYPLESESGGIGYARYLTNWTYSLQTLYHTMAFIAFFDRTGFLYRYVTLYWFFWPVRMAIWAVFWLVFLVLEDSPGLLTSLFDHIDPGIVLLGDRIYHVVTYAFIEYELTESIDDHEHMFFLNGYGIFRRISLQAMLSIIYVCIYTMINDFTTVYHLNDIKWWHMLLMYLFFSFIPNIYRMYSLTPHSRRKGQGRGFAVTKEAIIEAGGKFKEDEEEKDDIPTVGQASGLCLFGTADEDQMTLMEDNSCALQIEVIV